MSFSLELSGKFLPWDRESHSTWITLLVPIYYWITIQFPWRNPLIESQVGFLNVSTCLLFWRSWILYKAKSNGKYSCSSATLCHVSTYLLLQSFFVGIGPFWHNHSGESDKVLKRETGAFPFGSQTAETKDPKILKFLLESHAGGRKRLKPGAIRGGTFLPEVISQSSDGLSDHLSGKTRS